MKLELQQTMKEKTRAEYAQETQLQRQVIAQMVTAIVAAELSKHDDYLNDITPANQALLVAHATRLAFAIASAVTAEDIKRHGNRIDHE